MELLKDDRLLPLAAKYASRLGRMHLADKLSNLADAWERDADKFNVAQNTHFQELESQETYDVTNTEQDLNTSLIIPQKTVKKKTENDIPIKPVVSPFPLNIFYSLVIMSTNELISDHYFVALKLRLRLTVCEY